MCPLNISSNKERRMAKNDFSIEFNKKQLTEIELMLGTLYKKAPNVVRSAINSTMTDAKKMLQKYIKDNYNLPPKTVNNAFYQKRASQTNLEAFVNIKGEPLEYKEFKPTNVGKRGVKVKVMKNGNSSVTPKLFWADLPAGGQKHRAIMQRLPGSTYEKDPWKTYRITKKLDDTKIEKKMGPSIPGMVWGEDGVFEKLSPNIQIMLQNHIEEAVKKMLESKKEV